ncbi:MAG: AAA family ATPase [Thermodesulfovibrio sp.]|nr:AAA family ATPase [Thermodesulfovibrio sp.]
MDYLKFFELSEDPFRLTPDPYYYYPSEEHNEILSSLNYAVEQKEGFFLATGEPGTGKTTILKVFIDNWKDKAEIALIMTPGLTPEEFLMVVLDDLNVRFTNTNKNEIMKSFRNFLIQSSMAGKRVIIIVDEVQDLPDATLEELRLLSNLETEREKLLQIVLIGQPEFRTKLLQDEFRQIHQRIAVKVALRPLTGRGTSDYINYRLIKGGKGSINFDEKAKRLIHRFSNGIPRLINIISSRAMMAAYIDGNKTIKKRHIQYSMKHLTEIPAPKHTINWTKRLAYVALTMIVVSALTFVAVSSRYFDSVKIFGVTLGDIFFEQSPAVVKPLRVRPVAQPDPAQTIQTSTAEQTEKAKHEEKKMSVIVIADSANLRSEPSFNTRDVTWVSKGAVLDIMDEVTDSTGRKWYKVKTSDGKEWWVVDRVVSLLP